MDVFSLRKDLQADFWSSTSPDLRQFVEHCDSLEDWTYHYSDMPETYEKIEKIVNDLAKVEPKGESSRDIIHNLIPLLSSIGFSSCMHALIWLDDMSKRRNGDGLGWSVIIYIEAIALSSTDNKLKVEAKNLVERLELILDFHIKCRLFVRGDILLKLKQAKIEKA